MQSIVRAETHWFVAIVLVLSLNGKECSILADGTAWDINGARLVAS